MTRTHLGLRSVGRLPILALLLVAMTTSPAKALDFRFWIDPNGGNYDDISNWSGNNVANTINDIAFFNLNNTYDVTLTSGVTTLVSKLLVVDDGDVTFNASGPTSATFEMDIGARFDQNVTLTQGPGLGDVTLNVDGQLDIQGGSTFNVLQGSDVTAVKLDMAGNGTNGTMVVDGVGSSLDVSFITQLGSLGATGTLTFQNGSTGNSLSSNVFLMVNSAQAGSTGRLNVLSGSTLQTGNINVGLSSSASAIQEGTLTVDGTSSTLTMTGASTLTIGDDINPNVVSDVIVSNSAVLSTGTGAILIQNSGHLDIQAGTFNANGNVTVDGGTVTRDSAPGGFNLAAGLTLTATNSAQINFGGAYTLDQGKTFDIQSNSDFTTTGSLNIDDGTINVSGGTFNANGNVNVNGGTITRSSSGIFALASGLTLTATNNAQISFGGDYFLEQDSIFDLQSGADFSTTGFLKIGFNGDGTLVVDGPGSSVTSGATSSWGSAGNTADVTFRNGAMGDLVGLNLSSTTAAGTTSIFRVESGAAVTTNFLIVVGSGVQGPIGTVSGTVTVDGVGSSLTQNGSSNLTVGNTFAGTATLNVQNGGTFTTGNGLVSIRATGTVNLLSGGTFNVIGDMTIDGGTVNLGGGFLSLPDESPLTGSTGTFNFTSGVLELRDAVTLSQPILDASLGGSTIGAGRELRILGVTTLPVGMSLDVGGGTLDTAGLVMSLGSTLRALVPSTVSTGTLLATAGSTIDATGSMTLGDASAVNGFYSNGNVLVGGGSTLTLLDANDAVLDSGAFVTLGGATAGTLAAPNGLTLDFGGNVIGFGTVNTPNDPFKPFTNNGNISGNSGAEPITLTGYIKGVGTLDNVVITGTDAPGFSAATVYRGSVTYAGEMEIEIGGTSPGSFDTLIHSGTATLGGILDLALINGFVPGLGDTFQFLTAATRVGTFASVLGLDLGGGLAFDVLYGLNDVTLQVISTVLVGDLDGDGFVGIADLNIVLGNWNQNVPPGNPLADPSGDGFVGIADLNTVLGNWNAGTPPGSTAVPEPGAFGLMGCLSLLALRGRRTR